MKTDVIIFDDHYLFVEAFRNFIINSEFEKNIILHEADDEKQLKILLDSFGGIMILSSDHYNSSDVYTALDEYRNLYPNLKIIIVSRSTDPKFIKKLFDKNVKGFLGKKSVGKDVVTAIKEVSEGKVYVSNNTKEILFNFICNSHSDEEKKNSIYGEELTAREKEVLVLVCEGLRSKEIADQLFISTHTVESHRKNIMLKFNIHNTSHLVKFALENKLVQ